MAGSKQYAKYIDIPAGDSIERKWFMDAEALKGERKVVNVSSSSTKSESPEAGQEIDVIYANTSSASVTVTIAAGSTVKTPNGQNITITIPVGGYGEASFINIGGIIYARGV